MTKNNATGPVPGPANSLDRKPASGQPAVGGAQTSFAARAASADAGAAGASRRDEGRNGWLLRAAGIGVVALAFTTARGPDKSRAATPALSFDAQAASGALLVPARAIGGASLLPIDPEMGLLPPAPPSIRADGLQLAALPTSRTDAGPSSAATAAPVAPSPALKPRAVISFARAAAESDLAGGVILEKRKSGGVRMAALGKPDATANKATSGGSLDGRISTGSQKVGCLPTGLKRVLNQVVSNFGPVRINSTWRSPQHNRNVGGASRSLHLECRAIDFAYGGGRREKVIKFLRAHNAVGGLGNYGSGGHIHIDDGPHRSW